jgi:hypothetical protein
VSTYDSFAYHMGIRFRKLDEVRFNSLDSIERRQDIKEYESANLQFYQNSICQVIS